MAVGATAQAHIDTALDGGVAAVREATSREEERSVDAPYCATRGHHQVRELVPRFRVQAAQCSEDRHARHQHMVESPRRAEVGKLPSQSCLRRLPSKSGAPDGVAIAGLKVVMARCARAAI